MIIINNRGLLENGVGQKQLCCRATVTSGWRGQYDYC